MENSWLDRTVLAILFFSRTLRSPLPLIWVQTLPRQSIENQIQLTGGILYEMAATPGEITEALIRLKKGDSSIQSRLATLVYGELRIIAGRHMRRESPGHVLQPSALVNEAFLRLVDQNRGFENRGHFFAIASSLMRRILVDYARKQQASKRGGSALHISFADAERTSGETTKYIEMLSLHGALSRLSIVDERQAKIVEMRYFGGMSDQEISDTLGVSVRTVLRDWRCARAWLHSELSS